MTCGQIAARMGTSPSAVSQLISRATSALEARGVEAPQVVAAQEVDAMLPRATRVYRKALKEYEGDDKDKDRAVNVATNILKGRQVLVSKTQEDRTHTQHSIEEKRLTAILDNKLTDQLGLDRDIIDVEAIVEDEPTTPPAGGTTKGDG